MRHLVNLLEFGVCYLFYILIVDVTGPIVLADPLYACGEIKKDHKIKKASRCEMHPEAFFYFKNHNFIYLFDKL